MRGWPGRRFALLWVSAPSGDSFVLALLDTARQYSALSAYDASQLGLADQKTAAGLAFIIGDGRNKWEIDGSGLKVLSGNHPFSYIGADILDTPGLSKTWDKDGLRLRFRPPPPPAPEKYKPIDPCQPWKDEIADLRKQLAARDRRIEALERQLKG